MGLFDRILDVLKNKNHSDGNTPSTPTLQNSKYLEQKSKLAGYKIKANKLNNNTFKAMVNDLESLMSEYPNMEFDEKFNDLKDFLETKLSHKEQFLLNYEKSYKFSKSKEEYAKYFAEGHYCEYNDKKGYVYDGGNPLYVSTDRKGLLALAIYGDQLTIFTNDANNKFYGQLKDAEIKRGIGSLDEWESSFLIIEKNLSMADPYVLKTLLKQSHRKYIDRFFNEIVGGRDLGQIYDKIGFADTAKFFNDAKALYNENFVTFKDKLDEILPDMSKTKILDEIIIDKTKECDIELTDVSSIEINEVIK